MTLFRLLSAQPQIDGKAWRIRGQIHQDTWYEDAYGQNPVPFQQPRSSPVRVLPFPWQPASERPEASTITDAIYGSNATFSLDLDTSSYPATVTISGVHPVNATAQGTPPIMPLVGSTASTGGYILPGTYYIGITLGVAGPISHLTTCVVPAGTNTNTITVSGIQWPNDGIHHTAAILFMGTSVLNMQSLGFVSTGWTGSSPDANGNPTVATATVAVPNGGVGQPDVTFQSYAVIESSIAHGGVWGDVVTTATGSGSQIVSFAGSGGAWTVNQWAGYTLSLYYRPGTRQPILNYPVASNTTGGLTVTGVLPGAGFRADDVVVLRAKAGSITSTTIGDAQFINSYAPSGLAPSTEPGRLILIIAGTGAGQPAKTIVSSTTTVFTISQPWDVTPDATSIFIVVTPVAAYEYSTKEVANNGTMSVAVPIATVPAITAAAQSLLIQVAPVGSDGQYFPMRYQPFREVYIPPQNPGSTVAGPAYTVPVVAGVATPDAAKGQNLLTLTSANCLTDANGVLYAILAGPINYDTTVSSVTQWQLSVLQDPTTPSGGYALIFSSGYAVSFSLATKDSPANTQSKAVLATDWTGTTTPLSSQIDQPI